MGKIGKPQKSKKHMKVKKTYDSKYSRPNNLQNKSILKDLAPENEDEQEVPRKVKNIMKNQQQIQKKGEKKKMKKRIDIDDEFRMERGMSRPLKPAPRFVQGKRETDDHFLRRVSLETHRVLMKAQIEDRYKVDITEPGSGRPVIKKQKTEKKKQKEREKKRKKIEALKEKRQDRRGDFSQFTDSVKFGEVAMEPPSLTAKPRKAALDSDTDKPGRRNLLLSQYMDDKVFTKTSPPTEKSISKTKTIAKRETGKTVRRKFLSPAQQRITDSQRQRAIDLYRKIKDKTVKQR